MSNRNSKFSIYLPIAFSLVLIAGMWIGSIINRSKTPNVSLFNFHNPKTNKVDNVIDYISRDYVDSVHVDELETYAIDGMLEDLDPHSQYIPAKEFNEVNDPLLGSFEGIGIKGPKGNQSQCFHFQERGSKTFEFYNYTQCNPHIQP